MEKSRVNTINPPDINLLESEELISRIDGIKIPNNRKVILVSEDMTRPEREVCTMVLERIIKQSGIENVTLVIGNGMHRAPSRDELIGKFGWRVQWVRTLYNNPMCDRDWLSDLKKKDNAYVVSLSSTFSHMHVGMSGGDKVITPGCSHWNTVRHFHASKREHAIRLMREVGLEIIDYYVCMVVNWNCFCLDIYCGSSTYELDEFRGRARDCFKVVIPEDPPDAVLLEPTIKMFDFEQCMNVFNIIRSGETDKQLVKSGGIIGIHAFPVDGMGVHYMFQAINGISPVYFDEVFEAELKNRHIVIISNNLAENAIQDFFKTRVMVFRSPGKFRELVEAKFDNPTINHYVSPETMIGV